VRGEKGGEEIKFSGRGIGQGGKKMLKIAVGETHPSGGGTSPPPSPLLAHVWRIGKNRTHISTF